MTEDEIIDRTDANYYAMAAALCTRHPLGEVRAKGGLLCAATPLPVAQFNVAFVTRPLDDGAGLLREAAAFFDERGVPFVVRIREGLDPAAERACEALGLAYSDTVPGMALTSLVAPPAPPDLEIRTARVGAALDEHRRVVTTAFGMPLEMAERLFTDTILTSRDMETYVGYVKGEAVATSVLLAFERVAGVYSVATLPEARGRGYGEAMTWQCVRRGAELGCVISALQASEMGRPVYERMGYRLVSSYRTFHRPGA
jgi:GNAT superfamily N-acetyltransferase